MYHDVRRRLPYYFPDLKDGLNYRAVAGCVRIYFVNLLPALAFQLDMNHHTGGFFGLNEALLSSALVAMVFSIFAVQPLTVVGITGLISLFNYTIHHVIQLQDVSLYPSFMVWVGICSGIFHWLTAFTNLCDYMRTVTDFSAQTFALYVGTIYIIKGVEELSIAFYDKDHHQWLCFLHDRYPLHAYSLLPGKGPHYDIRSRLDQTLPLRLRLSFSYYLLDWLCPLPWQSLHRRLQVPSYPTCLYPTVDRPWVVDFWNIPIRGVFIAIPFGLLMTLLFYYDHNVSSLTAQARHFPLKKPAGFHWDFFLLGCTCFAAGILNIPLPNGLVPQAPVHTECCTTYSEHPIEICTTKSVSEDGDAPPVVIENQTTADHVAEQRVSHFLMGLALIGTMTGPLLEILHLMPRAVFSGVFFVVGWGSIEPNGIITKLLYLLREPRFRQPYDPLNKVPKRQIWHFVGWQLLGWACTVAIS